MRVLAGLTLFVFCFEFSFLNPLWAKEEFRHGVESLEKEDLKPNDQENDLSSKNHAWFLKGVPRDLKLSLKESFVPWGVLALAGGAALSLGVKTLDQDLKEALGPNELFNARTNQVMEWAFSPYILSGTSLALWLAGHYSHHPKLALTGRALSEALFLSMGINMVAKLAFRRERPDGGNFSFPSGHVTSAFTTAGVLTVFYGWKGALPAYSLATLVSLNRLDGHHHWLSDVVMGAALGSVVGIGTARFLKKDHPHLFLSPVVGKKHASLQVYYQF
ncbi:MAG: phosphatase PAP2 family protein [Deltaproteobacteria bacterium]|nr:phosphatase PAP2 family protein [Deltaproteobacteria bacterium]